MARLVRAMCPGQHWDDATPDAWAMTMAEVSSDDATTAVRDLGRRQVFIAPADVIAEVRRLRAHRLEGLNDVIHALGSYPGDPDDVAGEQRWRRAVIARLADGHVPDRERAQTLAIAAAATDQGAGVARVRAVIDGVHAEQRARAAAHTARDVADETERTRQLTALTAMPTPDPEGVPA